MFAWLLDRLRSRVPAMSDTERAALEAGDVWADAELFSGRPDLAHLLAEPYPELTPEERAFLDGPVERVCEMVDDWQLWRRRELPDEVWDFLRRQGFFGLVIPPEHGGKGFSSLACSTIFGKLASRSLALSAVVLIPNSVGPGELLLAYGTDEQKRHYLPRLARGEEIPCFALTEPEAGSDAASLTSRGVVFRDAAGQLALRLDWEKRYITLAPVATLVGLACRLEDPEDLLGGGREPGITCVLVPASAPGVEIGRRHDPMGVPMPNGPTHGRGVVVGVGQIIGGPAGAGRGWRMLMETLAAGRAVSLPAQSVAGAKTVARLVGAYASVRRQFGLPIARFEGVAEPLGRIAGTTYLMEAARVFTCGALDSGRRPAVISAIVKYQQTELARRIVQDAMDVAGGAAICRGPRNLLGRGYLGAPIGITVEGANILTRTLIVFGQGALRCHPWSGRLLAALRDGDPGLFRRALLGQAAHFAGNLLRAARLGVSRGRLARTPVAGPAGPYARRLAWASARFALLADLALLGLGGDLKRRGRLSGRFADALSWMYLTLATLRRFEAEGRRHDDLPLLAWAAEHGLWQVQQACEGIAENLPGALPGALVRGLLAPWIRFNRLARSPSDRLGEAAAAVLGQPGERRDRLTADIFRPRDPGSPAAELEQALLLAVQCQPVLDSLRRAQRGGRLAGRGSGDLVAAALEAGLLSAAQAELLRSGEAALSRAIAVDSFSREEYLELYGVRPPAGAPIALET